MSDCVRINNADTRWIIEQYDVFDISSCPVVTMSQLELATHLENNITLENGFPPLTIVEGTQIGSAIWLCWAAAWGISMLKQALWSDNNLEK